MTFDLTVAWAFLVGCILAVPVYALRGQLRRAAVFSCIVLAEILVLALNGMRCPLTDLAARYTLERDGNYDIYLPEWLAQNNQRIFGTLFVAGELVLLRAWWQRRSVQRSPRARPTRS